MKCEKKYYNKLKEVKVYYKDKKITCLKKQVIFYSVFPIKNLA